MYNRASADPSGKPWSERKKWIWWDGAKWTGYDVPDFAATKAPTAAAKPGGIGLDALSGTDPFIMKADGVGWLYVPTGLVDGPLPTQYEPAESPVQNPLYKQQSSPVLKYWKDPANTLAAVGDPKFPYVMTTYRLTEHYLSGAMSRWLPWLAELQPELFVEISPELAQEKGIQNLDWVRISSPAGAGPGEGPGHAAPAPAPDRWPDDPSRRHAVALGLRRPRHRRHRERAHGAGRRSERDDSRRQGVRLQHRKGVALAPE